MFEVKLRYDQDFGPWGERKKKKRESDRHRQTDRKRKTDKQKRERQKEADIRNR